MHPFCEPLQDREATLLLTTLTVGGSDDVTIFQHLPPEARARLDEKAQALLGIVPDVGEPQVTPGLDGAHLDENLAQPAQHLPFQVAQSANLSVEVDGTALAGNGGEVLESFQDLDGQGDR